MGDKLEKLNGVINELEAQASEIKNYSAVLKKIESLGEDLNNNASKHDEIINKAEKISSLLGELNENLSHLLNDKIKGQTSIIEKYLSEYEVTLNNKLETVAKKKDIESSVEALSKRLDEISNNAEEREKNMLELLEKITKKKGLFFS